MKWDYQIFLTTYAQMGQHDHRGDAVYTCTHHAAVGMAQQYGMSIEERSVATTLSGLQRAEKGSTRKKRVNLTKSIKMLSCSHGKV